MRCHIKVYGNVQGVGFRYYTQQKAKEYRIKGWVRNLPDGTVEAQAEGRKDVLERFVQALKKGSPASRVSKVDVKKIKEKLHETAFEIKT